MDTVDPTLIIALLVIGSSATFRYSSVSDAGESLPLHTVIGLSSCMSMVQGATNKTNSSSLSDKEYNGSVDSKDSTEGANHNTNDSSASTSTSPALCSVNVNSYKFVSLDHAPYTLIAQGNSEESDQTLGTYLTDIRQLILTYLGDGVVSPDDVTAIKGIVDLIHDQLLSYTVDLSSLCGGSRWIHLEDEVRDQLDQQLAALESRSSHATNSSTSATGVETDITGTMLVLGNSILHSRIPNTIARQVHRQQSQGEGQDS